VRGDDASLPVLRRVRAVLGDEQHAVHRWHPRLLHDDGNLRAVHLERAVRRDGAGMQHDDPRLSGLRQRR
jgi:hypothetical protein